MRILLIRPYPELNIARCLEHGFLHLEPLDLEIVAGGIPECDIVTILDLSIEKYPVEKLREQIDSLRPDITAFTGYSSHARQVRRLAQMVKEIHPDTLTVVGGIHATIAAVDYKIAEIDLVVRGEGGSVIADILRRLKNGESPAFGDAVLSTKDPEFEDKAKLPPPAYPDVCDVPAPRRDLVNRDKYFSVWTPDSASELKTMFPVVATVRTSVGCAFRCSFCVVHYLMSGKYIQRTPEDVVEEIAGLKETNIYFVDDEMFLNANRAKRIAELIIERGIKKHYYSWARSDTIVRHPDLFRLWKKAGLGTLYVGLESMVDSQLEGFHKKTKAKTNRDAIAILRKIGLTLHGCFIVHPNFSVEDFRSLEKDVLSLCPAEVTFTVLSPSPGTEIWKTQKDDFICDPYYFYDCMHSLLPTKLPLKRFYAHFSRLTQLALRANPLRVNKIRIPFRDVLRAIFVGTRYIFALRSIYKDYETPAGGSPCGAGKGADDGGGASKAT